MEAAELAHLRGARDLLDREHARPLDVPAMARAALMSPSLFADALFTGRGLRSSIRFNVTLTRF